MIHPLSSSQTNSPNENQHLTWGQVFKEKSKRLAALQKICVWTRLDTWVYTIYRCWGNTPGLLQNTWRHTTCLSQIKIYWRSHTRCRRWPTSDLQNLTDFQWWGVYGLVFVFYSFVGVKHLFVAVLVDIMRQLKTAPPQGRFTPWAVCWPRTDAQMHHVALFVILFGSNRSVAQV